MVPPIKTLHTRGFTIVELLVVIGLFAVIAAIIIVMLNPARLFAEQRNAQRTADVRALQSAIQQNAMDNQGAFSCATGGTVPVTSTQMASSDGYNICSCLVSTYLPALPFDPSVTGGYYTSCTSFRSGYYIQQSPTTTFITISAPSAELGMVVSSTQ